MDSVYLCNKYGLPLYHDGWIELTRNLEWLIDHWDQPDEGIWETRGGRRNYTYSRLMSWIAVERAIRIARQRGLPADIPRWSAVRDRIYNQIMERGWDPVRRAFVQHYDTDVLDASLLLMPLCKFIVPTDPRWISTLDAITAELVSNSLVYRYNAAASPDGLAGKEATSRCVPFGGWRPSPGPGDSTRRGWPSRRCSPTRTTSGCTPKRSGRRGSSSATSPRRSRTWR
jgi:GH15 family glucan-1,4-alpha-glucosidase